MPSVSVDGNDPVEMWRASRDAVARARRGGGPTLIEARTFRFEGHNYGDPGQYIPEAEYAKALANDPSPRLRAMLMGPGHADAWKPGRLEVKMSAVAGDAARTSGGWGKK